MPSEYLPNGVIRVEDRVSGFTFDLRAFDEFTTMAMNSDQKKEHWRKTINAHFNFHEPKSQKVNG